jgi:hypothetical protein
MFGFTIYHCFMYSHRCFHYGGANEADQGGVRFVDAFLIIWIGAAIVTVNIQLLKGNVYVCVLLKA